jgi:ubiquitin C-terminal hydrolase
VLVQRAPQTLVVQLQRFKHVNWRTSAEKIATNVLFSVNEPLDLTLNMFTRDESYPTQYELQAVCSHIGSAMNSGHYVAYARDTSSEESTGGKNWLKFDDDLVTSVDEATVCQETKRTAYILFYTQLNPSAARSPTKTKLEQETGDCGAVNEGNT